MANYQYHFVSRPDQMDDNIDLLVDRLHQAKVKLGKLGYIAGIPRIAFSQVTDEGLPDSPINLADFSESIELGNHCYLESTCTPAFHSQAVKLTVVKCNQGVSGKIVIGDNVQLQGTAIIAYDRVTIGNNVVFGPMVTVMDCSGHTLTGRGQAGEVAKLKPKAVSIGDNVWIGANVMILKGVTIGDNAVIGAGSVVYESIPANAIALGNPAKIVKHISPDYIKAAS
ncbi:acyltransferase [Motilimonas cestriensis]|uniref:Acyltransferase n=1 Tax=Motilimonas cestriensis TaxID=2742685 RepID=A0ABS8WFV1_9GAMM|nr:acyltransferase [Motilimonas cestriensis]MCE2597227.1 acyltransferase [Motilimonas cestriensis]